MAPHQSVVDLEHVALGEVWAGMKCESEYDRLEVALEGWAAMVMANSYCSGVTLAEVCLSLEDPRRNYLLTVAVVEA